MGAEMAAAQLNQTIIEGNSRYIDVLLKESESGKGKGKGSFGPDPVGSGRVFVRGFDFGTSEAQLMGHMSGAGGNVLAVQWEGKGEAAIIYEQAHEAQAAAAQLHQTIIQ